MRAATSFYRACAINFVRAGRRCILAVEPLVHWLQPQVDSLLHTVNADLPTGGIVSIGELKAKDYRYPGFEPRSCIGIPGAVGTFNVVFMICGGVY
jgi:hypothetical protein